MSSRLTSLLLFALVGLHTVSATLRIFSLSLLLSHSGKRAESSYHATLRSSQVGDVVGKIKEFETQDLLLSSQIGTEQVLVASDNDTEALLNDIEKLTEILGAIIDRENKEVYSLYSELKSLALSRSKGDKIALTKMVDIASRVDPETALGVTRAFTQTLNLINAAEVHHCTRRLRVMDNAMQRNSPLPLIDNSIAGTITMLLANTNDHHQTGVLTDEGSSKAFDLEGTLDQKKARIFEALLKQKVDIVLTAHPTEVNRRTLLRKYRTISEILALLDRKDLTHYERAQALDSLRREVGSIWGSDEIRRVKPTPQQESRGGIAILESVIWDAVPSYLRKLNGQCLQSLQRKLPLDHVPISFSSWMGGDRDGNPNVTPQVTHEVATTQRMQAARLLFADLDKLYSEIAICKGFSSEMLDLAREVKNSADKRELYRRVIGHLRLRLHATIEWCAAELKSPGLGRSLVPDGDDETAPILGHPSAPLFDQKDVFIPLKIMHESLCEGGYSDVADGLLVDVIRRVATFGLTLVPLDIRQESGRHAATLDAITKYLGLGSYASWDEETKLTWLQSELNSRRPLFRIREIEMLGFDAQTVEILKTFETLSTLGPGSLGAYVISMSKSASDVLAVLLLQKQFGMTPSSGKMMRVVPLFETLDDLTNSEKIVETLFSLPTYLGSIKGKQEIMVGYSDSAKDAGRLAASWVLYEAQEKMVKVAEKYNIDITFFHGKGGTVGRGGNPALYRAVLAHPPKTINGKFRVTEQGEMITQNFGSTGIAERTLDIYTAAVLAEKFVQHVDPKPEWRAIMAELSTVSCNAYRSMIEKESFIRYFRSATPELELGSLNIGSRPAKRNPKGGIESLRAIPWTFAWTQTRLHLPAWFGIGHALECEGNDLRLQSLTQMYKDWPFFKEMIDLIAMTLSKTDFGISAVYETQLIKNNEDLLFNLGKEIRNELIRTRRTVLLVTGGTDLSKGFALFKKSMHVRLPYVDPLNVLQAEMMKRLRLFTASEAKPNSASEAAGAPAMINVDIKLKQDAEERGYVEDTLVVSINGIAQGMKNSG